MYGCWKNLIASDQRHSMLKILDRAHDQEYELFVHSTESPKRDNADILSNLLETSDVY